MAGVAIIAFLAGLAVGSFATAVAYRLPRGMPFGLERSQCPRCGAQIGARDNIPVVSWLLLRGKARCCGAPISPRYPLTEIIVGALYAATVIVYRHDAAEAAIGLVFVAMLAVVTLTDLDKRIIPNKALLAGSVICLAIAIPTDPGGVAERLISAAAAGGLFFLVVLAAPRGMGLGDAKLVATMGLFLGRAVAPAILAGLLAGSVVGLALIASRGTQARKMTIPFGPFLALGGVVGLLAGHHLVDLYLN
ncbi:MAG TPA: prepilin peptidase [Solirubrobacterales bacterium]|nr:prepilin peptidase [Solirubrobacterales bacterium]